MADPLEQAAQRLEASAKALVDFPALMRAATAQQQAQQQIARTQGLPAVLQIRAELESGRAGQAGELNLAQAQGRVAFGQTAAGQAAGQAQAATGQQQTLADLQQARQRADAEVAHLRTPQGQAQAQQMRAEQNRLEAAQREAQALKEGPASTMDTLGAAVKGVTSVFGALKTVTTQVIGTLMEVGGKASPTHAATLQVSADLLMARVGQAFLPAMEELSRNLQNLAHIIPGKEAGTVLGAIQDYGGRTASSLQPGNALAGAGGILGRLYDAAFNPKPGTGFLENIKNVAGFGPQAQPDLSYKALPQATMGTFEQQTDRMQMAGLQYGPLDTQLLTEQLDALKELVGLIRTGVGPEAPVDVNFR